VALNRLLGATCKQLRAPSLKLGTCPIRGPGIILSEHVTSHCVAATKRWCQC
jgi:hypothetical protein